MNFGEVMVLGEFVDDLRMVCDKYGVKIDTFANIKIVYSKKALRVVVNKKKQVGLGGKRYDLDTKFIKKFLEEKYITTVSISDSLGLSNTVVSHWLRKRSRPNLLMVKKMAKFLGLSVNDILLGDENKNELLEEMSKRYPLDSDKIRDFLRRENKTITSLCLAIGISNPVFSRWLSGKASPNLEMVQRISKELGLEESELIK